MRKPPTYAALPRRLEVFTWWEIKVDNAAILAPLSGTVIPLEALPDETLSEEISGDGCGIEQNDGTVYASFDGLVTQIANTLHPQD